MAVRTFGRRKKSARKVKASQKQTKLKKNLTPGTVVILLAGRFRGRRCVFIKQLESGLLLVTGPYAVNGVPLRRVNQRFCITTSTKVGLKGADYSKIDDKFFAREKAAKAKKSEGKFFAADEKKEGISDDKKKKQKSLDEPVVKGIDALTKSYLKARFSLTANSYPHEMKF
eukprot:gnl/TRDRNA2_/TRDRNA2_178276_c0_seq1.p2 gnl/TRDRNA2_/TRDRNA2_178276_c0~~gnl/TRDRNA2_/TRDRNA2_178276_c0_seq1.p2  ORF type:complete len:171 (+),score=61.75 gnl/TRDRNA2_/TRDRNA2_178276_c0_seq1:61-573(+)